MTGGVEVSITFSAGPGICALFGVSKCCAGSVEKTLQEMHMTEPLYFLLLVLHWKQMRHM